MPRPRKPRNCRHHQGDRVFKPRSIPMPELQILTLRDDELEALRLCDLEGLDQFGAGVKMGVSRGTVQRLLKNGRATLVRAVVENAALVIGSGTDVLSSRRGREGDRVATPTVIQSEGNDQR